MYPVYITKTSTFLPNSPVQNDEIEQYIGMIGGKPSRAKDIILRNNGIKERYYALDKSGNITHSAYDMAVKAIEKLYDENLNVDNLELLAAGTTSQEMIMPSHAVQIHGEMGGTKPYGGCLVRRILLQWDACLEICLPVTRVRR